MKQSASQRSGMSKQSLESVIQNDPAFQKELKSWGFRWILLNISWGWENNVEITDPNLIMAFPSTDNSREKRTAHERSVPTSPAQILNLP